MNKKTIRLIIVSVVVIIFGIIVYFISTNKEFQSSIDKNELSQKSEIVVCGKEYYADVVMIDGVDIVKKIVELKLLEGDCVLNVDGNKIGVKQETDENQNIINVALYDKDDKRQSVDPFHQSAEIYMIDLNKELIYLQSQFDGSYNELGKL